MMRSSYHAFFSSSLRVILQTVLCLFFCLAIGYAKIAVTYSSIGYSSLPDWSSGQQEKALPAIQTSCTKIIARAKYRNPRTDPRATSAWRKSCEAMLGLPSSASNSQVRQALARHFMPYQITTHPHQTGLFTGYYEPSTPGSLHRTSYYRVPLYGKPDTYRRMRINGKLRSVWKVNGRYERLPTRKQISDGPLLPNTPVLAWIHSKVDRFFMGIQGSGSVTLPDGKRLLLGYAGQNGHKYYPIGRYLVQKGYLSKHNISLQTIKAWLNQHPGQAEAVMDLNPSFVFFRKLNVEHPIGAQGVSLTPGHSLAIDPKYYRYGSLFWLSTSWPKLKDNKIVADKPFNRLMVAQDTGGAIKGPIRGDIFFGPGQHAEWLAGHMQMPGTLILLYPKGLKP